MQQARSGAAYRVCCGSCHSIPPLTGGILRPFVLLCMAFSFDFIYLMASALCPTPLARNSLLFPLLHSFVLASLLFVPFLSLFSHLARMHQEFNAPRGPDIVGGRVGR